MNRTTILSPTVASLAIIRDNSCAPPGAAIRHVAVFLACIASCGKHQFQIQTQAFAGSEDGRDVTDWLGSVIPPGADIALRPASSMLDPSPATDLESPSPWWPIADMAWLRQRFGEEPRIYTLNLSNSDIRETAEVMGLPCAMPGDPWQVRAAHGASEAQAIWCHLQAHTCSDDEIAYRIDAWKAWISAGQYQPQR
jgi:hypothetical protein